MSLSQWREYLDAFSRYLEEVRLDLESGTSASLFARPPLAPGGPVPDEFVVQARQLLAEAGSLLLVGKTRKEDVANRLAQMDQRSAVATRLVSVDEKL